MLFLELGLRQSFLFCDKRQPATRQCENATTYLDIFDTLLYVKNVVIKMDSRHYCLFSSNGTDNSCLALKRCQIVATVVAWVPSSAVISWVGWGLPGRALSTKRLMEQILRMARLRKRSPVLLYLSYIIGKLQERFWRISLYIYDAVVKLYVTYKFIKEREMVENFVN